MAGLHQIEHRFVAGLRADTELEYAIVGSRVRWNDLHIQLSELDGACGIVCTLQCTMILAAFKRRDVEEIASAKAGPLKALWQLARRAYFKGTDEQEIERLVAVFAPRLQSRTVPASHTKHLAQEIVAAIEAGDVPILGIETRGWSHWTLVIGFERQHGKSQALSLLCLDAGYSRPWGIFYNARCALQASEYGENGKPKRYSLRYATTDGEEHRARAAHAGGATHVSLGPRRNSLCLKQAVLGIHKQCKPLISLAYSQIDVKHQAHLRQGFPRMTQLIHVTIISLVAIFNY